MPRFGRQGRAEQSVICHANGPGWPAICGKVRVRSGALGVILSRSRVSPYPASVKYLVTYIPYGTLHCETRYLNLGSQRWRRVWVWPQIEIRREPFPNRLNVPYSPLPDPGRIENRSRTGQVQVLPSFPTQTLPEIYTLDG